MSTEPTNPAENVASPEEAALEKLAAVGGDNFDRSQIDALKAKLAKMSSSDKKTTSGSEAPVDAPTNMPAADARPLTGRDVDWSEYNLDFNVAHLYPRAVYRETPQGPKWVAMITDFHSTSRNFGGHGKRVNAPGSVDGQETEALNLGEYLNDMCNGREEWKIAAVMPVGSACGLLLERQVPIILPDPLPLKKSEEVEPPTDPALQNVEDAALEFMNHQEGVDNEAPVGDHTSAPTADIGLRPIEAGSEEAAAIKESLDETGAVPARHGAVVTKAIETAAPMTTEAPTAGVVQPEGIENPLLGGKPVPAAGYAAAADILRALSDPNFRAQLPTEE